jgi:hypothetical protein
MHENNNNGLQVQCTCKVTYLQPRALPIGLDWRVGAAPVVVNGGRRKVWTRIGAARAECDVPMDDTEEVENTRADSVT